MLDLVYNINSLIQVILNY